jgi:hypothetical protein
MSKQITNEEAYDGLLDYYFTSPDDEKYADFDHFWRNTISMVVQNSLGWISGITDEGYSKVVEAYTELAELGYFNRNQED